MAAVVVTANGSVTIGNTNTTTTLGAIAGSTLALTGNASIGSASFTGSSGNPMWIWNSSVPVVTSFAVYQGQNGQTTLNSALGQPLSMKINNTEYITLASSGLVGVGTTSPQYTLDVNGQPRFSLPPQCGGTGNLLVRAYTLDIDRTAEGTNNTGGFPLSRGRPLGTTVASTIDFNAAVALNGGNNTYLTGRHTGYIMPPTTDTYVFSLVADDGARMYVNNQFAVGVAYTSANVSSAGIPLTAGQWVPFAVEAWQSTGGIGLSATWKNSSVANTALQHSSNAAAGFQFAWDTGDAAPTRTTTAVVDNQLLLANGTVSMPGLSFTGQPSVNSGLYMPVANSVGFVVNGSEGMRLTANGLGIGTQTPQYAADISGSARVTNCLYMNNQTNNQMISLYAGNVANSADVNFYGFGVNSYTLRYQAQYSASHIFYTGNAQTMALSSTGNLVVAGQIIQPYTQSWFYVTPTSGASSSGQLAVPTTLFTFQNNINGSNLMTPNGNKTLYGQPSATLTFPWTGIYSITWIARFPEFGYGRERRVSRRRIQHVLRRDQHAERERDAVGKHEHDLIQLLCLLHRILCRWRLHLSPRVLQHHEQLVWRRHGIVSIHQPHPENGLTG